MWRVKCATSKVHEFFIPGQEYAVTGGELVDNRGHRWGIKTFRTLEEINNYIFFEGLFTFEEAESIIDLEPVEQPEQQLPSSTGVFSRIKSLFKRRNR